MISELNHIAILTRDLAESVSFYRDRLGGTVAWSDGVEAIGLRFVYVQLGGAFIELLHMPEISPRTPSWRSTTSPCTPTIWALPSGSTGTAWV